MDSMGIATLIFLGALIILIGLMIGIGRLGSFIAERIRQRDENLATQLEIVQSRERLEAAKLRFLEIEHGLPISHSILDGDNE